MNDTIEKNKFNMPTITNSETIETNVADFCFENRIIPSALIIGIQKCGTSTLSEILSQYRGITNGNIKEHHFFDNPYQNYNHYIKRFPKCNENIVRTYDATPNYTNPLSSSPENIARFYKHIGLDTKKLIFIAMVCSNARRIPSAFYHEKRNDKFRHYYNSTTTLNDWFKWAFNRHLQNRSSPINIFFDPSPSIFRRGYYDSIFDEYFKLFADSAFLFIDSEYAFIEMQKLGDFVANQLNLPPRIIRYVHKDGIWRRWKQKKNGLVEKLTWFNSKLLNEFYSIHEKRFITLVNLNPNAKTFPANNFLRTFS